MTSDCFNTKHKLYSELLDASEKISLYVSSAFVPLFIFLLAIIPYILMYLNGNTDGVFGISTLIRFLSISPFATYLFLKSFISKNNVNVTVIGLLSLYASITITLIVLIINVIYILVDSGRFLLAGSAPYGVTLFANVELLICASYYLPLNGYILSLTLQIKSRLPSLLNKIESVFLIDDDDESRTLICENMGKRFLEENYSVNRVQLSLSSSSMENMFFYIAITFLIPVAFLTLKTAGYWIVIQQTTIIVLTTLLMSIFTPLLLGVFRRSYLYKIKKKGQIIYFKAEFFSIVMILTVTIALCIKHDTSNIHRIILYAINLAAIYDISSYNPICRRKKYINISKLHKGFLMNIYERNRADIFDILENSRVWKWKNYIPIPNKSIRLLKKGNFILLGESRETTMDKQNIVFVIISLVASLVMTYWSTSLFVNLSIYSAYVILSPITLDLYRRHSNFIKLSSNLIDADSENNIPILVLITAFIVFGIIIIYSFSTSNTMLLKQSIICMTILITNNLIYLNKHGYINQNKQRREGT